MFNHQYVNLLFNESRGNVYGYFITDLKETWARDSLELGRVLTDFSTNRGYHNGYVALSKGHPDYGKDYDDIDVEVHGGLTFSQEVEYQNEKYWVVGFDTAHLGDNPENCNFKYVLKETENLFKQMVSRDIK